jgi:hypothetical protein
MGFARCGNFVQRATRQPAAEGGIDAGNAERQRAGTGAEPGGFLQGLQALAQFLEH